MPIIYIYKNGCAYKLENSKSNLFQYSLGNLGFESNQCSFAPLIMDEIILECPYGTMK